MAVTLTFGAVGFWHDFLKVTKSVTKVYRPGAGSALCGRPARGRLGLIAQSSPVLVALHVAFPFLKDVPVPLSIVGFLASPPGDGRRHQRGQAFSTA